ncbi:hypothetical protein EZS27_015095 [termite gut metagenome]|uniref:Uncharacterized protein n=1 Tax=termite gut metagenome TaxID=433724 RepID=A0A5J4RTZ2_9ZZZZ
MKFQKKCKMFFLKQKSYIFASQIIRNKTGNLNLLIEQ